MVSIMIQCLEKLSHVVCPGPSRKDVLSAVSVNLKPAKPTLSNQGPNFKEMYERLSFSVCKALKDKKIRSTERCVLKTVLYDGTTYKTRLKLIGKHRFTFAKGHSESQARKDYDMLASGKPIKKIVRSFSHKVIQSLKSY